MRTLRKFYLTNLARSDVYRQKSDPPYAGQFVPAYSNVEYVERDTLCLTEFAFSVFLLKHDKLRSNFDFTSQITSEPAAWNFEFWIRTRKFKPSWFITSEWTMFYRLLNHRRRCPGVMDTSDFDIIIFRNGFRQVSCHLMVPSSQTIGRCNPFDTEHHDITTYSPLTSVFRTGLQVENNGRTRLRRRATISIFNYSLYSQVEASLYRQTFQRLWSSLFRIQSS